MPAAGIPKNNPALQETLLSEEGEHSLRNMKPQSYAEKRRRAPNFLLLNLYQFGILLKRHLVSHFIFSPFSSLLRCLVPVLFVMGLVLFRLALTTQEQNEARKPVVVDNSFDVSQVYTDGSLDGMTFIYCDNHCTLDICTSGALKESITKKLGIKDSQVMKVDYYASLEDVFQKKSLHFMGGVVFDMQLSSYLQKYYGEYYNLDYTVIYNGTKLNKNVFLSDGSDTSADISPWIHKAVLDTLAEFSMQNSNGQLMDLNSLQQQQQEENNLVVAQENSDSSSAAEDAVTADTKFIIHPIPYLGQETLGQDSLYHNLLPVGILLSLFIVAIQTHYALNHERSSKARVAMRMMGLRQNPYWCSWFAIHTMFIAVGVVLCIIVGYIFQINFISRCNPIIMFFFLFFMGINLITNFFCCSVCCTTNRSTNVNGFLLIFASLAMFALFAPLLTLSKDSDTGGIITVGIFSYLSPLNVWMHTVPSVNYFKIALDISSQTMDRYNVTSQQWEAGPGFGISDLWNNMYPNLPSAVTYPPPTGVNLLLLVAITVAYFLLTLYLDNILPMTPGGTRQPFYYLLLPSYWGLSRAKGMANLGVDVARHRAEKFSSVLVDTDEDIYSEYQKVVGALETDNDDEQMRMPIKIVKLSKTYSTFLGLHSGGNKTALDSLTFSCDRNEVTVLLGHSSSGKSTTLNILTGIIPPSSGDALLSGNSVIYNMELIRQDMGVCMQEDIIFEGLSGYQMMELFAVIKGLPLRSISKEIRAKLHMVKLWKYRNQRAATYSGGMKRRLSLAIACLGDPRHLILDEISTGVDANARRLIWNILAQLKQDRSILLSTHDLNEAEMIADKVVILALGRARGIGTIPHLRNRYGGGFTVRTVTDKPQALKERVNDLLGREADIEAEAHGSITFEVPSVISEGVVNLFNFLEEQTKAAMKESSSEEKSKILVKDFDLSQTTLEQIFMRLTHGGKHGIYGRRGGENRQQQQQLNISIEGQTECVGCVMIGPNENDMNLEELRRRVNNAQYLGSAGDNFFFLSNGVAVSRAQERYRFAREFLPLMEVRLGGAGPSMAQPSAAAETQRREEMDQLRDMNKQLQQQNAQLLQMMESMRREMQELRSKNNDE